MYDRTRTALTLRVLDGLGQPEPAPRLRAAVRGWVGFVEEVTVDWLARGDLARDEVVGLLEDALVPLVTITTGDRLRGTPPDLAE